MSNVENVTAVAAETTPAVEAPTTEQQEATIEESKIEPLNPDAPATESSVAPVETAAVTEAKDEAAPAEEKKEEETAPAVEKVIEPISEGQLTYKGPGLLKSLIPSKKEFWLSDDAVPPQDMNSYLRGEKPEVANPVVAWASQSGKGLLFFNKKGDTTKKAPGGVLPLYDATDLKKQSPHEITFKLHGHEHTLKAANDSDRDGWFVSLEKAAEMGKVSKESVRESEGYKAEMEKLNKPNVSAVAASAAKTTPSQPKKSTEVEKSNAAERMNSDAEDDKKKSQKSRSTSRGMLNRLKGKKEEVEQKKEEKREEKKEEKEESKEDTKVAEPAPVVAPVVAPVAVSEAPAIVTSAEDKKDEVEEPTSAVDSTKAEEKPKASKRGSIFGKMQAGWGNMKSPTKEKEQKDAELKPEATTDAGVSENPPQLPETTTEPVDTPVIEETKAETAAKPEAAKEEVVSPGKEKPTFLSGLSFKNKRNRSVSPSQNMKDVPAKTETAPVKEETTEPAKVEEPAVESAVPVVADSTEKPAESVEEPTKAEQTANKRQSMLGSLGRRASKAIKGMQAPRKENAAPKTEAAKEETSEVKPVESTPIADGESKPTEEATPSIGDVVPEAVNIGQPQQTTAPVVAASA